jgi:histidine triad (HIT) family protein
MKFISTFDKKRGGSMMDCIFCKIIQNEIPSKKVYEDNEILVFEDINPVAPVHLIFIPKKHIETFNDLTDDDAPIISNIMKQAKNLAKEKKLSSDGYRIVLNCMPGAGQSVYHIHFHLLGGRIFQWPPG